MINKLPCFIFKNSTAIIHVTNGEIEDGHEKTLSTWEGRGQFSPTSKRVQTKEGIWTSLTGMFYMDEKISDDIEFFGRISINNSKFYSFKAHNLFNPDGSFHHAELEVGV